MKKFSFTMLVCLMVICSQAQEFSGPWNGVLKVPGGQLRIVFNIEKNASGYTSTLDSPDQGAKGIPTTSTTVEDKRLQIKISNLKAEYTGVLNDSDSIKGTFVQAGFEIPLTLQRGNVEMKKFNRPQTPAEPFPYYSEDVTFPNAKAGITLAGTLTLPSKNGTFPAVVLISGSGPQDRNEELLHHKPFLVIADHLTRNGIAVLRYDDRGTAKSTGVFKTATSDDFATDADAAVHYLLTRKEIQKKHIGLAGHSEGGLIAPLVAVQSSHVSFIILLAGPGISGDRILLMQEELIGKADGMSEADVQDMLATNKAIFTMIKQSSDTALLKKELTNFLLQKIKESPANEKPQHVSDEELANQQINVLISPWMLNFIRFDPAATLEKVMCPVLALNGEKDLQVPAKANLEAIQKYIHKGGNKDVSAYELPGLNHLFQECISGSPKEYETIEQTFAPAALNIMTSWIKKHVK